MHSIWQERVTNKTKLEKNIGDVKAFAFVLVDVLMNRCIFYIRATLARFGYSLEISLNCILKHYIFLHVFHIACLLFDLIIIIFVYFNS